MWERGKVHSVQGMNVRVWFEYPPIPDRRFDYCAIDADNYDGGDAIGWGRTEQDAITDLLNEIEWRKS